MRRSYEAYGQGDMDGALQSVDPQIEIYDHDIPDSGTYSGLEGLSRWQADWEASWESWRWVPEEFVDLGERVIAVLRVFARGRHSGTEVERLDAAVWTIRDGKAVRLDYYGSKEEAFEAVGLRE